MSCIMSFQCSMTEAARELIADRERADAENIFLCSNVAIYAIILNTQPHVKLKGLVYYS